MLLKRFLESLPGFRFMSEADVEHVAAAMRVDDYPAGHCFICQDKLNKELYLLLEGRVKVTHYAATGRQYELKTLQPGEFFGLPSLSEGKPASASCIAEGPVRAASLPFSAYLLLFQPDSEIGCRFQFVIASQLALDLHDRHEALRGLVARVYGAAPGEGAPAPLEQIG